MKFTNSTLIRIAAVLTPLLALSLLSPPLLAQDQPTPAAVSAALLRGRVLDPAGASIANAAITATAETGGRTFSSTSNSQGEFELSLEPGHYSIAVSAPSFAVAAAQVNLSPGASLAIQFTLQLPSVRSAVTVTDSVSYQAAATASATHTPVLLRDLPQSVTVITRQLISDQAISSIAGLARYIPGVTAIQGENNRDQLVIRGNSTSADFFLNGLRDDVQYYRDLYNVERVEALKGSNALAFGRGGGGGVINRVLKEPEFASLHELTLSGGSFGDRRLAADLNHPLAPSLAGRLNAMYEHSGSFRDFGWLERFGVNPVVSWAPASRTRITAGYEHFSDHRGADRGIPSFAGRPVNVPVETFYGNPDLSKVRALVDSGSLSVQQQAGRWNLRNSTLIRNYDRGYQNFVPGAVNPAQTLVSVSAYNNATQRLNFFNQTDFTYRADFLRIQHTLLAGAEAGRQYTNNFRNTGFFDNSATSISVPFSNPVIFTPVTFRQSPTDADNHLNTTAASAYLQDQAAISGRIQFIAGLRFDHFDLRFHNHRNGDHLRRIDNLLSPRAGIVFKPVASVSLYSSYSVSFLPSSGDQFSSLTAVTQQLKPERFTNYEIGAKWDAARPVSLTAALYRLDRTNTRSLDPNNPAAIIQTGSTRNLGFEAGVNGRLTRAWNVLGGYAWQNSFISSSTASAQRGFKVGQVPHHSFSLWNHYRFWPRLQGGLGIIHRSDMFAAVDNLVTLPGYTTADAALFFELTEKARFQFNVENLFNARYFLNADSNTNISPGSPRSLRAALVVHF